MDFCPFSRFGESGVNNVCRHSPLEGIAAILQKSRYTLWLANNAVGGRMELDACGGIRRRWRLVYEWRRQRLPSIFNDWNKCQAKKNGPPRPRED